MKRLENGLIEGVEYVYDVNGKINWLKMIPEEYLYINYDKKAAIEKRLNKSFNEVSVSEVLDTELVITLQGIRYLLDLRGYKDCDIRLDVATPEYVAATCKIRFLSSEEQFEQTFTSSASAHFSNTKSWYKNYLVEAASNRALCRAVRFFLKINIVSKEELGMEKENIEDQTRSQAQTLLQPTQILAKLLKEKDISFEDAIKDIKNNENWKEIKDIPNSVIFSIIGKIKANK